MFHAVYSILVAGITTSAQEACQLDFFGKATPQQVSHTAKMLSNYYLIPGSIFQLQAANEVLIDTKQIIEHSYQSIDKDPLYLSISAFLNSIYHDDANIIPFFSKEVLEKLTQLAHNTVDPDTLKVLKVVLKEGFDYPDEQGFPVRINKDMTYYQVAAVLATLAEKKIHALPNKALDESPYADEQGIRPK